MKISKKPKHVHGMTLIELTIVVAVMGILMATAVPSYRSYTLRVHRTEAIRMLLQASMCQERLIASRGSYDTGLCKPASDQQRYELAYNSPDSQGRTYLAIAIPTGAQLADPCGSLMLDQSGIRRISAANVSVAKCWNGR
ncbi:MAG TPA: type IV pilin protein [Xanthomonadales bacterium]